MSDERDSQGAPVPSHAARKRGPSGEDTYMRHSLVSAPHGWGRCSAWQISIVASTLGVVKDDGG